MSNYPNNSYIEDKLDHNTKWCDLPVQQVFQFDHQPSNVIQVGESRNTGVGAGATTNGEYNNLYQLTRRLQNKQLNGWQSWMNWVEKIQPDYKFLTILQKNAQTCIFANVDDPWMFTQYIYKGIGKKYDHQKDQGKRAVESKYIVIQPPLYKWDDLSTVNRQAKCKQYIDNGTECEEVDKQYYKQVESLGWYKEEFGQYVYSKYTTGVDGCGLGKAQLLVQCVKWGQHGNIPPHVVDMVAPQSYLKSATKMTLKTLSKPVVGIPLYSDKNGVFRLVGQQLYIDSISFSENSGSSSTVTDKLPTFTGSITESTEKLIPPTSTGRSDYGSLYMVSTQRQNGQLLFNGCKYFQKLSQNQYGCVLDKNFSIEQRKKAFCDANNCTKTNTKCKYYTKSFNLDSPMVIVARYQMHQTRFMDTDVSAKNAAKQLQQLAASTLFMGAAGATTALQLASSMSMGGKDASRQGSQVKIQYQTAYQMVETPVGGVQVYVPPNAQNYRGAIVTRGTGQSAFQLPAFGDERIIYNNDISQINFTRWMQQIMPCYERKFCNQVVGKNSIQKKKGYCNCGVDYKQIGDNNQVVTKNSGHCPYYSQPSNKNMGCPYNSVNKTAYDFALHNKLLYQNLYLTTVLPITQYFATSDNLHFQNNQLLAQCSAVGDNGDQTFVLYYKDFGDSGRNFQNDDVAIIKLSSTYGIQQQVLLKNHNDNLWQLCKVRFFKDDEIGGLKIHNKRVQCDVFVRYWPYDCGDYTNGSSVSRLRDQDGEQIQWVIKVQQSQLPKKDPLFVDNEIKFIGGYHPQYMNYPASPQEILYKKEQSYGEYDALQSKAQASQFGETSLAAKKTVQYGYFVKQTGDWILDSGSIGELIQWSQGTISQSKKGRAQSPTSSFKGSRTLHDRWSNSIIDPQAQKPTNKEIKNCLIYSNDTVASVQQLRKNPPQVTQQGEVGQSKPRKVPPRISYPQYLPRQRMGCYCTNCDQVLALRFYQFTKEVTKCPWCGEEFTKKTPMTKFPRTKAMGRISVWGLPGTIVKTDSYFWKSQAKVNNALIQQMCFKLGTKNPTGGGYSVTKNSADSQKVDRVPYDSKAGKYFMGLTQGLQQYLSSSKSSISTSSISSSSSFEPQDNIIMVNPNIGQKVVSFSTTQTKMADNRVVNPFTTDYNGLKMVTTDYITSFRNRLQPTLAYIVGKKAQQRGLSNSYSISSNGQQITSASQDPASPNEYQIYKVKYDQRRQLSYIKQWVKYKSVVTNVVLAYAGPADSQAKAFVQFPVGDQEQFYWGKKYYPPDPHWWFNNGYIGGIATDLQGNQCHIDRSGKQPPGYRWNTYSNLQNNLYSSVFICSHGYIPIDKQIGKVYLVQPGTQYSCNVAPVGEFQIPGMNLIRVAYNHYHSFSMCDAHEEFGQHVHGDSGNFADGDVRAVKLPKEIEDQDKVPSVFNSKQTSRYVDAYGDVFYIDPQNGLPIYQRKYKQKYRKFFETKLQSNSKFQLWDQWHVQNLPYVSRMKNVNLQSCLTNLARYKDTHLGQNPVGYGKVSVDCLKWDGFGTDLVQTKSENAIWKQYTTQQFLQFQQQYKAEIQYEIDFGNGQVTTFTYPQYYAPFNSFISQQMQNIPGYFDQSSYNTSGLIKQHQNIKVSQSQDIQGQYQDVIVTQSNKYRLNDAGSNSSNSGIFVDAGESDKAVEITEKFENIYYPRQRVDFIAKTSQKYLSQFYSLQSSRWTGVGSQQNSNERINYNKRINYNNRKESSDNYGYLLNCNYWYPKLGQQSVIDFTQFEQIQIQKEIFYYTIKQKKYYYINSPGTFSVIKIKKQYEQGQEKETKETKTVSLLQSQNSTSSSTVTILQLQSLVTKLQQGGVQNVSVVNNNIIINAGEDTTYQFDGLKESLGMNDDLFYQSDKLSNRIVQFSDYCGEYHPYYLTDYYNGNNTKAWKTLSNKDIVQHCIIDLYHTPRQKQRRNYRAQPGHDDYTNGYCDNQQCIAYGQDSIYAFAKKQGASFSSSTSTCPFCSQELKGGSTVSGDGIPTFVYESLFQQQQIIKKIAIKLIDSESEVVCPFGLFISNDLSSWQCILSGFPNGVGQYSCSNGYTTGESDFTTYDAKKLNDFILNSSQLFRGRYLKICVSPVALNCILTCNGASNYSKDKYIVPNSITSDNNQVTSISQLSDSALKGCYCVISYTVYKKGEDGTQTPTYHQYNAVISQNIGQKIYFNQLPFDNSAIITRVIINAKLYKTCFAQLKVFGCSYVSSQLKITPKPTVQNFNYSSIINLNYLPIRFFKVGLQINDSYQVILDQILNYNNIDTDDGLRIFVEQKSQNFNVAKRDDNGNLVLDENGRIQYENRQIKYYQIKQGRFYFDVAKKRIMIPRYYYATTNIIEKEFGQQGASSTDSSKNLIDGNDLKYTNGQDEQGNDINSSYYRISSIQLTSNLKKWGVSKQVLPSKVNVVLWSGLQGGVTLNVTALTMGPIAQLQKGSICFIDTPKFKNGGSQSQGTYNGISTPLPDTSSTYDSYGAINANAKQKTIPWIVYNNDAIVKRISDVSQQGSGKFKVNTIATSRVQLGQDWFQENIMGQGCTRAVGICEGQVILKGKPNTILQGDILFHAAAVTKRKFCGNVISYQLTGGLKKAGVLVTPKVKKEKKRAAFAYQQPYLLVYMVQRSPMPKNGTEPKYMNTSYRNISEFVQQSQNA